ncbi:MAG: hypothetical protein ACNS60_20575 [Candidatus Cyclobacteriaceae bacterium M2_1C_046]
MTNLNLIDDYLANRMNDAERISFEEKLQADSELRQEFNFHKDIVNSIKEARKVELKSMLNEIPVSSAPTTGIGTGTKLAAGLIVGAIVIGGFLYFMDDDKAPFKDETTKEQSLQQEQTKEEAPEVVEEETIVEDQAEPTVPVEEQDQQPQVSAQPEVSRPAEISTPDVMDFETEENEIEIKQPEATAEAGDYSIKELFNSTIEVVTDNSKKKYDFHYQFKDNKLYLFGDFNEELYQILEFNKKDNERTVILYYKDAYYMLDENQKEITALKAIEDQQIVDQLNRLRK